MWQIMYHHYFQLELQFLHYLIRFHCQTPIIFHLLLAALISAIPTSFIPPQTPLQRSQAKVNNLLSSLIEENYRGEWLQGYINWYAKDIKSKTEYSDFCQV